MDKEKVDQFVLFAHWFPSEKRIFAQGTNIKNAFWLSFY